MPCMQSQVSLEEGGSRQREILLLRRQSDSLSGERFQDAKLLALKMEEGAPEPKNARKAAPEAENWN